MSLTARVKSIDALGEWKSSLKRFVSEAWEALQSAEQKIRRTEEWLQERLSYWRHEVERCEKEVWEAKRDLERCEEEDDDNDCSTEEETLLEARRRLRKAEIELENVRGWKQSVSEMAAAYRVQADRLSRLLAIDLPRADAFLGRAIADLHAYVRVTLPSEGVAVPVSSSQFPENIASDDKPTTWQVTGTSKEKEHIQNALRRLSETERGSEIAASIQKCGTTVHFGRLPKDEIGKYRPDLNLIIINKDYRHRPSNVLAAYLAHEGTHLHWSRGQPNTVLEESAAYKAQVEVWREVKDEESDQSCDFWDSIFRQDDGDKEAMWWVRDMRKGLKEKP